MRTRRVISDGETTIGELEFYDCTGLTDIIGKKKR